MMYSIKPLSLTLKETYPIMPGHPKPQVSPAEPPPDQRLTPTDIAQFLRLNECPRYLKMRLHERRKGSKFLAKYSVAPQAIPPLLTLSGQRFEQHIEHAASAKFRVIHCGNDDPSDTDEKAESNAPPGEAFHQAQGDNVRVIALAGALPRGETLLIFQPRLEAVLGGWYFTGDLDILRLDRDGDGKLSALIVDMKSTTKVKLEHRLQVAFYHDMLQSVFQGAGVAVAQISLGIVYRGPACMEMDAMTAQEAEQRTAAQHWLGVTDALLEVIADPENYLAEVREMIIGSGAVVNRIARTAFRDTPFHLSYKCDGCLYNEWCMKAAFEDDDLSLIPTLKASEKHLFQAGGLATTTEVAGLMQLTVSTGGRPRLVAAGGQEEVVRRLWASALGPRLAEIVHRAKAVAQSRCREIEKAQARRGQETAEQDGLELGTKTIRTKKGVAA